MIAVCDMGPLHYLVLLGAEDLLPRLFTRIAIPAAVLAEMQRAGAPDAVRQWAAAPPAWIEILEPAAVEEIPALGRKGQRGAGEKAAIAVALELIADYLVIDDRAGRREAAKRGLSTLWTLQVLDEAADRGWVEDLPALLDRLEYETPFYIGEVARGAIEAMKQRDRERKEAKPPGAGPPSSQGDGAPEPLD